MSKTMMYKQKKMQYFIRDLKDIALFKEPLWIFFKLELF